MNTACNLTIRLFLLLIIFLGLHTLGYRPWVGALCATLLAFTMLLWHRLNTNYSKVLIVPYHYDNTMEKAIAALTALGSQINHISFDQGIILATRAQGIANCGENISVQVKSVNRNQSKILVESEYIYGLYNWGQNKSNVLNCFKLIKGNLNETSACAN